MGKLDGGPQLGKNGNAIFIGGKGEKWEIHEKMTEKKNLGKGVRRKTGE